MVSALDFRSEGGWAARETTVTQERKIVETTVRYSNKEKD